MSNSGTATTRRALLAAAFGCYALVVLAELLWPAGILRFLAGQALLAALLVAAVRAGAFGTAQDAAMAAPPHEHARAARRAFGAAVGALTVGLVVLVFGAITTRTPGAAAACQGFPLCNGQLVPEPVVQAHIHWTHRLSAYLLALHALGATIATLRRGAPRAVRRAALAALALVAAQIVAGAAHVLLHLPRELHVVHLAVGTAVWSALVVWTALAHRWRTERLVGAADEPVVRA